MKNVQSIVNKVTLGNIRHVTKMMKSLLSNNHDKLDKTANVIMNQVIIVKFILCNNNLWIYL